jgi:intracellular multiplication protein IcmP
LAPGQFAFLKWVDRRLWFALHSLGFESEDVEVYPHHCAVVEAVGAREHWEAEKCAGRAIAIPALDRSIIAIKQQLGV